MGNSKKLNPYTPKNQLCELSASISVRVRGTDAFLTLNAPKKKGLWPAIMQALLDNDIEVVNATLSTNADTDFHCIHAKLPQSSGLETEDLERIFEDLVMAELNIQACKL